MSFNYVFLSLKQCCFMTSLAWSPGYYIPCHLMLKR